MEEKEKEKEISDFKNRLSSLAEHYTEYLVIVKTSENNLMWRARDTTWGVGAADRYLRCMDEIDRLDERNIQ